MNRAETPVWIATPISINSAGIGNDWSLTRLLFSHVSKFQRMHNGVNCCVHTAHYTALTMVSQFQPGLRRKRAKTCWHLSNHKGSSCNDNNNIITSNSGNIRIIENANLAYQHSGHAYKYFCKSDHCTQCTYASMVHTVQ